MKLLEEHVVRQSDRKSGDGQVWVAFGNFRKGRRRAHSYVGNHDGNSGRCRPRSRSRWCKGRCSHTKKLICDRTINPRASCACPMKDGTQVLAHPWIELGVDRDVDIFRWSYTF